MPRLALLIISLVSLAACKEPNPVSCARPENAGKNGCPDAGGGQMCSSDIDCMPVVIQTPACDTVLKQCFECTPSSFAKCSRSPLPHCEVHSCVACFDDGDCPNSVCISSTGACASTTPPILQAAANGSPSSDCVASPCLLERALIVARDAGHPSFVKLAPGTYAPAGGGYTIDTDMSSMVTIDARGATIRQKDPNAPVITVNAGKWLTLLGGTIEGVAASNADGILCGGSLGNLGNLAIYDATVTNHGKLGVNANFCGLTLVRSMITANHDGGLSATNGSFVIIGNRIIGNGIVAGMPVANNAGVTLNAQLAANRFEFNTVANNGVDTGISTAGVDCKPAGFTAANNIIWGNRIKNAGSSAQTASNCAHSYSSIGMPAYAGAGMMNVATDPMLTADGHLGNTMLIKLANPAADLTGPAERDIDHDRRISPADLGADQLPRP